MYECPSPDGGRRLATASGWTYPKVWPRGETVAQGGQSTHEHVRCWWSSLVDLTVVVPIATAAATVIAAVFVCCCCCCCCFAAAVAAAVPAGLPSRGGDVTVYVLDINQPSLPHSFYSVLLSVSVFMAVSTVLHSMNSSDKLSAFSLCSPGLISAFLVLSTIYLVMKVSLSPDVILCG